MEFQTHRHVSLWIPSDSLILYQLLWIFHEHYGFEVDTHIASAIAISVTGQESPVGETDAGIHAGTLYYTALPVGRID